MRRAACSRSCKAARSSSSLAFGITPPIWGKLSRLISSRNRVDAWGSSGSVAPVTTGAKWRSDPLHLTVGELFLNVFKAAGWRIAKLEKPPNVQRAEPLDYDRAMLMLFMVRDPNQL